MYLPEDVPHMLCRCTVLDMGKLQVLADALHNALCSLVLQQPVEMLFALSNQLRCSLHSATS
jgi:hypothetical protein